MQPMMRLALPAGAFLLFACADPTAVRTVASASAVEAKAPPKPTFITVTSTVYDRDGSGALVATRADDHDVVGSANYTEANGVTSHISLDAGGWQMLLANQTARTIHLAVADPGFPVPDGYYYDKVEVYARCADANDVAQSLLSMAGGDSNANCTFGLDFAYARTKYKLVMGPQYPGTGRALVQCTSAPGVACSAWTVTSAPSVSNAGVANLFRFANNGSLVSAGTFHNSYSISLTSH
jgi:hypothetical protein